MFLVARVRLLVRRGAATGPTGRPCVRACASLRSLSGVPVGRSRRVPAVWRCVAAATDNNRSDLLSLSSRLDVTSASKGGEFSISCETL
ncbi:hypothetical protein MTO96_012955 [Rhipicephalus appendiculatus]